MIYRYKSAAGRFADVEMEDRDRTRIDRMIGAHGFTFLERAPTSKVALIPFEEFARMMGGARDAGPQLVGPQPGGGSGPVGYVGAERSSGGGIAIPL